MPSFSVDLESAIHRAIALANERKHELATLEHLLLSLTDEPEVAEVMEACNVKLDSLKTELTRFIDEELTSLVSEIDGSEAAPTTGFQRAVQRAAIHVQSSHRDIVSGGNLLVAMFAERESHAAFFLSEAGITRYDAVNYVSNGVARNPSYNNRIPIVERYDVDSTESSDETVVEDDNEKEVSKITRRIIASRVLDNTDSVRFFAEFMAKMVKADIDATSSLKPNSHEGQRAKAEKIELLELFLLAFTRIAEALHCLAECPEDERGHYVAREVQSSWRPVGSFLAERAPDWLSSGANLGLVGAGVAFFGMIGLPPSVAAASATATITAPMLLKFAGRVNVSLSNDNNAENG